MVEQTRKKTKFIIGQYLDDFLNGFLDQILCNLNTSFVMFPSPFTSIDLKSRSKCVSSPINSSKDNFPSKSLSISIKNFSTSSLNTQNLMNEIWYRIIEIQWQININLNYQYGYLSLLCRFDWRVKPIGFNFITLPVCWQH